MNGFAIVLCAAALAVTTTAQTKNGMPGRPGEMMEGIGNTPPDRVRQNLEDLDRKSLSTPPPGKRESGYELSMRLAFEKEVEKFLAASAGFEKQPLSARSQTFKELKKRADGIIRGIKEFIPESDLRNTDPTSLTLSELSIRLTRLSERLPLLVKSRRDGLLGLKESREVYEHLRAVQILAAEMTKGGPG